MFDVVTTSICRYTRYEGGPELDDRTLALRLFRKRASKGYPLRDERIPAVTRSEMKAAWEFGMCGMCMVRS